MSKTTNAPEAPFPQFEGFDTPEQNWFRMPHNWTDITAAITNIAELKVVEYILRHTWGYQEYNIKKRITMDEFVHGRKRQDGSRMDSGTGLSERAVRYGIINALKHGFIEEEVDDSDRGRIKKYYRLKMRHADEGASSEQSLQSGVQSLHPQVQALQDRGANFTPRTEKETIERNLEKDRKISNIRTAEKAENDGDTIQSSEQGSEEVLEAKGIKREAKTRGSTTNKDKPVQHQNPSKSRNVEEAQEIEKYRRSAAQLYVNSPPSGFASAGAHVVQQYHTLLTVGLSEDDQDRLAYYVGQAAGELHDNAPLKSSTSRARNIYKQSGLVFGEFLSRFQQCRSKAKERNKGMAYFFACLEELCGVQTTRKQPQKRE